jgi:hypothetical protein
LFDGIEGKGYRWEGNLVSGEAITNQTHAGVRRIEANLQRAGDGLLRPEASSPLQGMAIGKYKQVKEDMDGQPRKGAFDVGADQLSNVPIVNHPLTVAEVGPEWMKSIPDSKGAGAGHQ